MGTWEITIRGHGPHHNGRENDAEAMAKLFVEDLRAEGHSVETATHVLDGEGEGRDTDLLPPAQEGGAVHYPNGLDDPQVYDGGL